METQNKSSQVFLLEKNERLKLQYPNIIEAGNQIFGKHKQKSNQMLKQRNRPKSVVEDDNIFLGKNPIVTLNMKKSTMTVTC